MRSSRERLLLSSDYAYAMQPHCSGLQDLARVLRGRGAIVFVIASRVCTTDPANCKIRESALETRARKRSQLFSSSRFPRAENPSVTRKLILRRRYRERNYIIFTACSGGRDFYKYTCASRFFFSVCPRLIIIFFCNNP